jgi:tetratricopeptide (TPR) repeat protein
MTESKPGNKRLRCLRIELKRTQEEIVGDLNACADRMRASGKLSKRVDFSVRQYSKWEGLRSPWPHPETRMVLEEFFQRSIADLGFTSPYDEKSTSTPCEAPECMLPGGTAQELFALVSTTPVSATESAARVEIPLDSPLTPANIPSEEDDMMRRTLLRGLVTAGTSLGIPTETLNVLAAARQRMDLSLEATTFGPATLERWETTVFEYAHAYQTAPPQQLLGDIVADFTELQRLLEQRQPTGLRRRLCRIVGQFAALAGIFLSALGEHREARGWFHTGRLAAAEAEDKQLEGALMVRSAIVSLYYGSPASAYEQAVRARQVLGDFVGPSTSRAFVVEARALARLGRGDEALPLLRHAEDTFGLLTTEDRNDPALGYTERQLLFHLGNAWTHLGRCDDAWQAQRRALEMYPSNEYLDPTLIRLDRAMCLSGSGEPEGGISHRHRRPHVAASRAPYGHDAQVRRRLSP